MTLHKATQRKATRRAFTLMEMLIVVAIIVALAGIGTFYILPQFEKAKDGVAQAKAKSLEMALMAYNNDHGHFPDGSNLGVLTQKTDQGGPYISNDGLLDPWDKPFQVDPSGNTYNNGAKPDVFTRTPGGKIVGNFKSR
jgi:general secretion pathway protein G